MSTNRTEAKPSSLLATQAPLPLDADRWAAVVRAMGLSPQQARIVEALLRGNRDKQIALIVGLKVPTVRTYLKRIFLRVGVKDRVELILKVFALARSALPETGRRPSR